MSLESLIKNIEIKKGTKLDLIDFTNLPDSTISTGVFKLLDKDDDYMNNYMDDFVCIYKSSLYEIKKTELIINILMENNIIYNYNDMEYLKKAIDDIINEEIKKESYIKAKDNRESLYNCLTIDFYDFKNNLIEKLLAKIDYQKELKLIKIPTVGITTNSFSIENIQEDIKEIGFAKENTIFVNNEKMSLEDYYNKKYTKKNIEKIHKAKMCEDKDFIYIILKNNINQITQMLNITSMLYVLLYSEVEYLQSEILDCESVSNDIEKINNICFIYSKRTFETYNIKNKAPIFKPPLESTSVDNWFSEYKELDHKYQKRIMNFSFNLYKSFILKETDRFDNICKAIDSLFGIKGKVTISIKNNLIKIEDEFLNNSGVVTNLVDEKISIYWKIRNELVHGEIKDIKDSIHYIKYYSLYGKNIENDFLDILFLILKYSTKYFKNNMFIE